MNTTKKEEKMEKKWNLWHILGIHTCSNSTEVGNYGLGGETKIKYSNPWASFGTRYDHYQCQDCGKEYWMPKGNFEEIKMMEMQIKLLEEKQ